MTAAIGTVANPGVLGPILKDYYIGPLQEQLNNEVMVLQMFEKAKSSWAGRQGIVPVHVDRNSGVAFKAENDSLKPAGSQKTTGRFVHPATKPRNTSVTIRIRFI